MSPAIVTQRTRRYYRVPQALIVTEFAIPETPLEWRWEGHGIDGNLISRRPDNETPNNPEIGITRVVERFLNIPFPDIYQAFFSTIPAQNFSRTTAEVSGTDILFVLNIEE